MVATHPNILFVDDNTLLHGVIKNIAASEKWHVHLASNGEEGLSVLQSSDVDLILCDIMMPGMDGYEFYNKLREEASRAHIPCIFISGLNSQDERDRGRELGVDEYLPKPFEASDLVRVVKGKLRRSSELRAGIIEDQKNYRKKVIQTLSHELRTPLVSITTGAEVLLDSEKESDPKVRKVLEAILRGGLRLEKLINDFLVLQQIEAGAAEKIIRARSEIGSGSKIVEDWMDDEKARLEKEGFNVGIIVSDKHPLIKIYRPFFLDALNRLLSNAEKFSGETKEIGICVYDEEDRCVIEIKDRGIGIDPTRSKEALDLFGQLDRETLEQQGGGLGLPIANRYLNLHGATLTLEKREGGGTIARVIVPKAL